MEHAMHAAARLIRLLLGQSSVAKGKMACGRSLDLLGVDVDVRARFPLCTRSRQG